MIKILTNVIKKYVADNGHGLHDENDHGFLGWNGWGGRYRPLGSHTPAKAPC